MSRLYDFSNIFKQNKGTLETGLNNTKTTSNIKNNFDRVDKTYEVCDELDYFFYYIQDEIYLSSYKNKCVIYINEEGGFNYDYPSYGTNISQYI